jgi:hypothetical protein
MPERPHPWLTTMPDEFQPMNPVYFAPDTCPECEQPTLYFAFIWAKGWHSLRVCTTCRAMPAPTVTDALIYAEEPDLERVVLDMAPPEDDGPDDTSSCLICGRPVSPYGNSALVDYHPHYPDGLIHLDCAHTQD